MLNELEIVKTWNAEKGSRFPITASGSDSAIVREIKKMSEKYGAELVSEYFEEMIKVDTTGDIWKVCSEYKFNEWKRSKAEVKKEEKKEEVNVIGLLSNELLKLMGTELANKIGSEVEKRMNDYIEDKTLIKVVDYNGAYKKVEGVVHEQFETILKFVAMNEPVMLTGASGTGKNYIVKQVANALGLDFYFSNAVTQEYKLTGYGDANGEYVKTQFFDAFTKGGLFMLDEIDASCPEALIVLNCAIANGYFDFPVIGRVEAHENFRVIACGNTWGTGASMEYVGRNQLDGATLNRFAIVEVDYDKRIEDSVCPNKDIADFCRDFRRVCMKNGVHHIVSYREMSRLYKMIEIAKMDKAVALKTCLIKGLEKDTLRMIHCDLKSGVYADVLKDIIK